MHGEQEFQRRLELIERAIRELEATPDAGLRATMQQLVQSIMELHGGGLDRLMAIVRDTGAAGDAIVERLGQDPLVGSLLILYGLHPRDVRSRVADGLDTARAALGPKGVSLELVSLDEAAGLLRARLQGVRHGHGSTLEVVRQTIEEAVRATAPEVTSILLDDETVEAPAGASPLTLTDHRGLPLHRARARGASIVEERST
jgi:hypothetical protein